MKITVNSNNNEVMGVIKTLATILHEVDDDCASVDQMISKAESAIHSGKEITEKYYHMKWDYETCTMEIDISPELIAAGLEYTNKSIELWSPIFDMVKAAAKFGKSIGKQMVKLAKATFSKFERGKKYGVFHLCMPELGLNKVAMLRKVGNSTIDRVCIYDVDRSNVEQNSELANTILRTMANNGSIEFSIDSDEKAEVAVDEMLHELREKAKASASDEDPKEK